MYVSSQFHVIFWLLATYPCIAILPDRNFRMYAFLHRVYPLLLHSSCSLHASFFRLFARLFCPQASLPDCIPRLYDHVPRLHISWNPNPIHCFTLCTRISIWYCYRRRKHNRYRHYALCTQRRRIGLLWPHKQLGYVHRPYGRIIYA